MHDLPRVMRVPGFWHMKRTPSLARIVKCVPREKHGKLIDHEKPESLLAKASGTDEILRRLNQAAFSAGQRGANTDELIRMAVAQGLPEELACHEARNAFAVGRLLPREGVAA